MSIILPSTSTKSAALSSSNLSRHVRHSFQNHYGGIFMTTTPEESTTTPITTTRYSITCPPTNSTILRQTTWKHLTSLDRYLQAKPVAAHTQQAFQELWDHGLLHSNHNDRSPLVLDSGCGTGRSSLWLGKHHPTARVLGVDRSLARLSRNRYFLPPLAPAELSSSSAARDVRNVVDDDDSCRTPLVQQAGDNVWLVRADLVDFWQLLWQHQITVDHHYLLYPNPYPKKSRLQSRWYAHPVCPILLALSSPSSDRSSVTIRSNWRQYLVEFAQAVQDTAAYPFAECDDDDEDSRAPVAAAVTAAQRFFRHDTFAHGPQLRDPTVRPAVTNFEAKYDAVGEATYELTLGGSDDHERL